MKKKYFSVFSGYVIDIIAITTQPFSLHEFTFMFYIIL